jgi:uroporphyrinogen decarboxylase
MVPDPDYNRLLTTLRRGQADRVPLLELIVDAEIKAAFLGKEVLTVADDLEFWRAAGYDCATVYPDSHSLWFNNPVRQDTVIGDDFSASGQRRWASEGKGLIQGREDLARYPLPGIDAIDFSYFDTASKILPEGMGLIGAWGDIFTYTWEAMGFEAFSYALYDQEDLVAHIFQQLGKLAVQIYEALVCYDAVKALWYSDDLAYKTGLLVSPKVYRKYIFPWMRQIGELSHKAGRPFIFHSDGFLWNVMDDLVACKIDALQPIEPLAMDIGEVKRRYGQNFCVVGNVDVDLLAAGEPDEVRSRVQALLRDVAPGGGYCLGSGNTVPNYSRLENYQAMLDEGLRFGRYPIRRTGDR